MTGASTSWSKKSGKGLTPLLPAQMPQVAFLA